MFTGIIETTGTVTKVLSQNSNKTFLISSPISRDLRPDQSVSHNGICLTIERIHEDIHQITAIRETLAKTTLNEWKNGDIINLERCMTLNGRLDGHMVQGHVDTTGLCLEKKEFDGSWEIEIRFEQAFANLIIEKGSVSVNGISLTSYNISRNTFTLGIIPYTYNNTNISSLRKGDKVNLEFDVVGKYISRNFELQNINYPK